MSRSVVTPLATKSCSAEPRVLETCVCMSTRPGIRNLPRPSTRRASAGTRTAAAGPTAVMRSPSTTTVAPRSGGAPVPEISVTSTIAIRSAAAPALARHSSAVQATSLMMASARERGIGILREGVDLDRLVARRVGLLQAGLVLRGDHAGLRCELHERVARRLVDAAGAHRVADLGLDRERLDRLVERGLEPPEPRLVRRRQV